MTSWLISDLHLCAQRPAVTQAFLHWIQATLRTGDALYILGDFFEVWVGDDVIDTPTDGFNVTPILQGLRALADAGIQLYLMHGNRDFLIGSRLAEVCGLQLLNDPQRLTLAGRQVLLTHGDHLCTDDVAYQAFRKQVRDVHWQQQFLAQPLSARLAFASQARAQSSASKSMQRAEIMDVNADAVDQILRQYAYPDVLLHGHTHRPGRHRGLVDAHPYERVVLGDWHETAVVCAADDQGLTLHTLVLSA